MRDDDHEDEGERATRLPFHKVRIEVDDRWVGLDLTEDADGQTRAVFSLPSEHAHELLAVGARAVETLFSVGFFPGGRAWESNEVEAEFGPADETDEEQDP